MKTERVVAALQLMLREAQEVKWEGQEEWEAAHNRAVHDNDGDALERMEGSPEMALFYFAGWVESHAINLRTEIERTGIDWLGGSERASVTKRLRGIATGLKDDIETRAQISESCDSLADDVERTAIRAPLNQSEREAVVTCLRGVVERVQDISRRWGPLDEPMDAKLKECEALAKQLEEQPVIEQSTAETATGPTIPGKVGWPWQSPDDSGGPLLDVVRSAQRLCDAVKRGGRRPDDGKWVAVANAVHEAGEALSTFSLTATKDIRAELDGMGGIRPPTPGCCDAGTLQKTATALQSLRDAVETYLADETPEHRHALGLASFASAAAIASAVSTLAEIENAEAQGKPPGEQGDAYQDLLREVEAYLVHSGPDKRIGWECSRGQSLIWLRELLNKTNLDREATYELRHHPAGSSEIWKASEAPSHAREGTELLWKIRTARAGGATAPVTVRTDSGTWPVVDGADGPQAKCLLCGEFVTEATLRKELCPKCRTSAAAAVPAIALSPSTLDGIHRSQDAAEAREAHEQERPAGPDTCTVPRAESVAGTATEAGAEPFIRPELSAAAPRVLVIVDMQAGIRAAHNADYKALVTDAAKAYPGPVLAVCGDPYGQSTLELPKGIPVIWKGPENGGGDVVYAWLTGRGLVSPEMVVEVCGVNTNACVRDTATGLGDRLKAEHGFTDCVRIVLSLCRDDNGLVEFAQEVLPA